MDRRLSLFLSIGNLFHSDEENLLKGLLRQKEIPAIFIREERVMDQAKKRGMGWIPDYPDFRDYTEKTEEIHLVLGPKGVPKAKGIPIPIDLREWCSPVEDQGSLGSCTAQAGAGVIEYYERKSFGRPLAIS